MEPSRIEELTKTIRSMMAEGSSKEEIISTLIDMGYSREEAENAYLFALREVLSVYESRLKEVALEAIKEPDFQNKIVKRVETELLDELKSEIEDFKAKTFNLVQKELRNYGDSIANLEDKVSSIETALNAIKIELNNVKTERIKGSDRPLFVVLISIGLVLVGSVLTLYLFIQSQLGIMPYDYFLKLALALGLIAIGVFALI